MFLKKTGRYGRNVSDSPVRGPRRRKRRREIAVVFSAIVWAAVLWASVLFSSGQAAENSWAFTGVSTPKVAGKAPLSGVSGNFPAVSDASVTSTSATSTSVSRPAETNESTVRTPIPKAEVKKESTDSSGKKGGLLRPLINLLLVLGLVFGFFYVLRRWSPKQNTPLPPEVAESLGRFSLTAKVQLHLVRFGGRLLLLSVSEGRAEMVTEISDPQEVAAILVACRPGMKTGRDVTKKAEGGRP